MKSDYIEKLRDPRWQKKRLQILERDQWKCRHCGNSTRTLNVHHIVYDGEPWETHDDWLVTLCDNCHKAEPDEYKTVIHELLNVLSGIGLSTSKELQGLTWYIEVSASNVNKTSGDEPRVAYAKALCARIMAAVTDPDFVTHYTTKRPREEW